MSNSISSSLTPSSNKHKVDICVTCISDKAPQLPLREELPSLGIEVIYNAHGLGAKASRQESKRRLQKYRQRQHFFPPSPAQIKQEEDQLKVPKALSYKSYEHILSSMSNNNSIAQDPLAVSTSTDNDEDDTSTSSANWDSYSRSSTENNPARQVSSYESESISVNQENKKIDPPYHPTKKVSSPLATANRNDDVQRDESSSRRQLPPLSPLGGRDNGGVLQESPRHQSQSQPEPANVQSLDESPALSPIFCSSYDASTLTSMVDPSSHHRRSSKVVHFEAVQEVEETLPALRKAADGNVQETEEETTQIIPADPTDEDAETRHEVHESGVEILNYDLDEDRQEYHGSRQESSDHQSRVVELYDLTELSEDEEMFETRPHHSSNLLQHEKEEPGVMNISPLPAAEEDNLGASQTSGGGPLLNALAQQSLFEWGASLVRSQTKPDRIDLARESGSFYDIQSAPTEPTSHHSRLRDLDGDRMPSPTQPQETNIQSNTESLSPGAPFVHAPVESPTGGDSEIFSDKGQLSDIQDDERPQNDEDLESLVNDSDGNEYTEEEMRTMDPVAILTECTVLTKYVSERLGENLRVAEKLLPSEHRQYALHAVCAMRMDTAVFEDDLSTDDLLGDISMLLTTLGTLTKANSDAIFYKDSHGDYPVHLLARKLMAWEAAWYQKVYEKAQQESEYADESAQIITKLYHGMSQCIDMLLAPLAHVPERCKTPGSSGKMLPLHIACIFSVPYSTLHGVLVAYPEAARQKCELNGVQSFVPSGLYPLELHDRLSTDFPRWEIEGLTLNEDEQVDWSQTTLESTYGVKDCLRRSDLIFAFFPDLEPYNADEQRIRRLERRIAADAEKICLSSTPEQKLSDACKRIWCWLCCSSEETARESVHRICTSLTTTSLIMLSLATKKDGRHILDCASQLCAQEILAQLDQCAKRDVAIPAELLSSGNPMGHNSLVLRNWEKTISSELAPRGMGCVGPLCKTLFHVTDTSIPSSFVILPYKLVQDQNGDLGLASEADSKVAVNFSNVLFKLTSPMSLLHFLDKKTWRFRGEHLYNVSESEEDDESILNAELVNSFLDLYGHGPGFLYLIDDFSGTPIVPRSRGVYPLSISDPKDLVKKLLPLMLSGMLLMRGEQAMPILVETILQPRVVHPPSSWFDAAKDITGFIFSSQADWTHAFLQELMPHREDMLRFLEQETSRAGNDIDSTDSNEWVVEISLLRMLLEMHDVKHEYSGLKKLRLGSRFLWTSDAKAFQQHRYDFLSLAELQRIAAKPLNEEETLADSMSIIDEETEENGTILSSYGHLFQELALPSPRKLVQSAPVDHTLVATDNERLQAHIMESATIARTKYATAAFPIALEDYDDESMGIDTALQLRIRLDEQEAKMEYLSEKLAAIQEAEDELLREQDGIARVLDNVIDCRRELQESPSIRGLTSARQLLIRLCDLESKVLCREVELQQLDLYLSCFNLEDDSDDASQYSSSRETSL